MRVSSDKGTPASPPVRNATGRDSIYRELTGSRVSEEPRLFHGMRPAGQNAAPSVNNTEQTKGQTPLCVRTLWQWAFVD